MKKEPVIYQMHDYHKDMLVTIKSYKLIKI
jgi:hypothetical protein